MSSCLERKVFREIVTNSLEMRDLRESDFRRIIQLCGEVGEIRTADGRLEHFLHHALGLVQCDVLGLVALDRTSEGFELGPGYAVGVDQATLQFGQDWYMEQKNYLVDPFNQAMARQEVPTLRRQDLLAEREWYGNPIIEGWKTLGLSEVMVSVRKVRRNELGLVARREWGARVFSERDGANLDLLTQCFQWFYLELESENFFGPGPVEVPNRLQQLLPGLLRGLSEKEIAAEMFLSPRTVNKYMEQLFRKYGVNSRSQLMALWTRIPHRVGFTKVRVHS